MEMREWGEVRPQDIEAWESLANSARVTVGLGQIHWPMIVKALIAHIRQ